MSTESNEKWQTHPHLLLAEDDSSLNSLRRNVRELERNLLETKRALQKSEAERVLAQKECARLETHLRHSQKMEAMGLLAGSVAHDLNNILTGINGFGDMIRTNVPQDSPAFKYTQRILALARSGGNLNHKLLSFARPGKQESTPLGMHKVIDTVIDIVEHSFNRQIKVTKLLEADCDVVMGDVDQMLSGLLNIAVNARDAMPNGGELRFHTQVVTPGAELPCSFQRSEYLRIAISDTGQGMTPEVQARAFEPFFSTKQTGKGTGLGLATVHAYIQKLKGRTSIQSEAGKGTTLLLFIPLSRELSPRDSSTDPNPPVHGHGRILFVDDETFLRDLAKDLLVQLGYEVITCKDGQEAIDVFTRDHTSFDLAVLDVTMPNVGGLECLLRFRQIDSSVPILISTGSNLADHTQKALRESGVPQLPKPFSATMLSKTVAENIRKR